MRTKTQLLAEMKCLSACPAATAYVTGHTSRSANKIGQDCTEPGWLIWFLTRQKVDLSAFAFGCADRACRVYAPSELEKKGKVEEAAKLRALPKIVDRETALRARDAAADSAADSASAYGYACDYGYAADSAADSAAHYAAHYADEELVIQLTELKVLWKEWANG